MLIIFLIKIFIVYLHHINHKKQNKMEKQNKIQMTKDEIYIADSIINIIHRYSNIEKKEVVSKQMLKDIIGHCQSLQQIY